MPHLLPTVASPRDVSSIVKLLAVSVVSDFLPANSAQKVRTRTVGVEHTRAAVGIFERVDASVPRRVEFVDADLIAGRPPAGIR